MSLAWRYALIFLGSTVEGPAVTLAAAALAGAGVLDPFVVFLCAGTGNFVGDLGWYLLGWLGRIETLLRWFPRLSQFLPYVEQIKGEISQKAPRMLLIAKLAFGVTSIPTLIAAGIARVPWQRVVPAQLLGEIIWTGALMLIGIFFGQYAAQLEKDIQIIALISGVALILIVIWFVRRRLKTGVHGKPHQVDL